MVGYILFRIINAYTLHCRIANSSGRVRQEGMNTGRACLDRANEGMNAQAEPAGDRANEVEPRPNLVRTSPEPCPNFVRTLFEACPNFVRTLFEARPNFVRRLFGACSNLVRSLFESICCMVALGSFCTDFIALWKADDLFSC